MTNKNHPISHLLKPFLRTGDVFNPENFKVVVIVDHVSNEVNFLFISNFSCMIRIKLIMIKVSIAKTYLRHG